MNVGAIDVLDALKIAIQATKDLQKFYHDAASNIDSEEGSVIFKRLAQREAQHRKQLIKIYSQISGKKILYLNLNKKHKLNMLAANPSNKFDLVNIAKQNEKESRDFYLSISRRMLDEKTRKMFKELALEEEQHLAILESSFEKDPTTYGKMSVKAKSIANTV